MRRFAQTPVFFLTGIALCTVLTAAIVPQISTVFLGSTPDVNGDGFVDIVDIGLVTAHWGLQEGDPGWDDTCDLDNNAVIDVADITEVAIYWNTEVTAELAITDIRPDGRNEYIHITNAGYGLQDMTDWWIQSHRNSDCAPEPNQKYYFPFGCTLAAGASVTVHSGPDAPDNPPGQLFWTTSYIWHNAGDVGDLYNADDELIDSYAYGSCLNAPVPQTASAQISHQKSLDMR